jgi:hypothetical protein
MNDAISEEAVSPVIERLSKDLLAAAKTMTVVEARFLVDAYYIAQDDRKRSFNQVNALVGSSEPHAFLQWYANQNKILEGQLKKGLGIYSESSPLGRWCLSQVGVGPVIAAGLLAHIDLDKAPYVSSAWRYAGLDPTLEWLGRAKAEELVNSVMGKANTVEAGHIVSIATQTHRKVESIQLLATEENGSVTKRALIAGLAKRPWNADLKVLCWKIGQSFLKLSKREDCYYGKIFLKRWEYEKEKNMRGEYAIAAKAVLDRKKIGRTTDAYKAYSAGMLPPAHILQRSLRYAVKHFLSDYVVKGLEFAGKPIPVPYAIAHLEGHLHWRKPPN